MARQQSGPGTHSPLVPNSTFARRLGVAATLLALFLAPTSSEAQDPAPSLPRTYSDVTGSRPDPLDPSGRLVQAPAMFPAPSFAPEGYPVRVQMSPWEVMKESVFGEASQDHWEPLSLRTFFSEGWDKPYYQSPEADGATKQFWLGSAPGSFGRLAFAQFDYTQGLTANPGLFQFLDFWSPVKPMVRGDTYFGAVSILTPLNQRLAVRLTLPYITANQAGMDTPGYTSSVGDLTVDFWFRLIEQRKFSMIAVLSERIPTGSDRNGNGLNYVHPALQFWWNFAPKWVARGQTGISINTGTPSASSVYFNDLTLGRYFTDKDATCLKNLAIYFDTTTLSDTTGQSDHVTNVYLKPGFSFSFGEKANWSCTGVFAISVAGPQPWAWQPNIAIVRQF